MTGSVMHTINEIAVGTWLITVYDQDAPMQVMSVDYNRDLFTALEWKSRETWEKLTSDDIVKIINPPLKKVYQ